MSRSKKPHRGRYRPWISRTKSTKKILGGSWHTHHNERLAERKSKRYAKHNAARKERIAGKQFIQDELSEQ